MSKTTKINLLLGALLVLISVLTIIWHHQNHQLYKLSTATNAKNQKIMALHKQLLSESSKKEDGFFIKNKAKIQLKMQQPSAKQKRDIRL